MTESWLSPGIEGGYKFDDYQQFSTVRDSAHPRGGVLLFFNRSYSVHKISASVKPLNSCETVAVVNASQMKVTVGCLCTNLSVLLMTVDSCVTILAIF